MHQIDITTETPDARQSQRPVSHHRRADRRGRRTRLQFLSDQEAARGPADQCRPGRGQGPEQVREANLAIVRASTTFALFAGLVLWLLATPAGAEQVAREQDIADLR